MKDDELRAIVLLPILVVAALTVYQGLPLRRIPQAFSELAILGANMTATDYPRQLTVDQEFNLYLYVGNHEGKVTYYMILVKLGNRSNIINETVPMDTPVLREYERVLVSGEEWVSPITLSIKRTGVNLRLVFEMWIYDESIDSFSYRGRWNQLWLNVTTASQLR